MAFWPGVVSQCWSLEAKELLESIVPNKTKNTDSFFNFIVHLLVTLVSIKLSSSKV